MTLTAFDGLLILALGLVIGATLRSEKVWELQRRVEQLTDDLDWVRERQALARAKASHPAGKGLRSVPRQGA